MAITIREIMAKPKRKPAIPTKPIYERYIDNARIAITTEEVDLKTGMAKGSLECAKKRFVEGQGMKKAKAANNWRVVGYNDKPKDRVPGQNEIVAVYIKAGSAIVPILTNGETGESGLDEITIPSTNVVPVMEYFDEMLKDLDKKSDEGKVFHNTAIKGAVPRFKKGLEKEYSYNKKADDWIVHAPVKKGKEIIQSSEEVAEAWRAANKDCEDKVYVFGWKPPESPKTKKAVNKK